MSSFRIGSMVVGTTSETLRQNTRVKRVILLTNFRFSVCCSPVPLMQTFSLGSVWLFTVRVIVMILLSLFFFVNLWISFKLVRILCLVNFWTILITIPILHIIVLAEVVFRDRFIGLCLSVRDTIFFFVFRTLPQNGKLSTILNEHERLPFASNFDELFNRLGAGLRIRDMTLAHRRTHLLKFFCDVEHMKEKALNWFLKIGAHFLLFGNTGYKVLHSTSDPDLYFVKYLFKALPASALWAPSWSKWWSHRGTRRRRTAWFHRHSWVLQQEISQFGGVMKWVYLFITLTSIRSHSLSLIFYYYNQIIMI